MRARLLFALSLAMLILCVSLGTLLSSAGAAQGSEPNPAFLPVILRNNR